jgi:hypothetical protein
LGGFALIIFSVYDVNFCLAEEWTRVGERCIQNCDDQPVRAQNARGRPSQGQVKAQEQVKVQEQVTYAVLWTGKQVSDNCQYSVEEIAVGGHLP